MFVPSNEPRFSEAALRAPTCLAHSADLLFQVLPPPEFSAMRLLGSVVHLKGLVGPLGKIQSQIMVHVSAPELVPVCKARGRAQVKYILNYTRY
jgi:hypothetical protein